MASETERSPSALPTTEIDSTDSPAAKQDTKGEGVVTSEEWRAMQTVLHNIYAYRAADDHDPSRVFHRKVNKRALPEYYEVIKEPMALSTVKANINNRVYKKFSDFVRDFALIPHNAQLYNRPEAGAYQDALVIKSVLESELQKLVDQKIILAEVATLPDLGEIPPPSPRAPEEEGEEDDEDEDEDEEDDGEESEEEGGRRRRRRGPRSTAAITKREGGGRTEDPSKGHDLEARKKRGRPPRVDTPMEARIKAVLKGLRKVKGPGGELKISHFEKLPDKSLYPGYFTEIKNPMALDLIKRKAKRKKYQSVDQFMRDVETMFENAKMYNRDDSQIYKDAVDLQHESRILAEHEKKKPDSDYMMEDGRLPLPNGILYNSELWKVGDWVHIQNPNDLTKPIVAQIYRTWQDAEGQKWVNACWYYRPEQTVHRFERHFYEKEVVKTGQYRDHNIEEVVDRCFVMFFTRYNKGRPRNFPADKEVYVCESRYNEEKHKLNKIKTWASCLPDEVRERDYEMDLFDAPRKMKKVPSPIKHLLPPNAKETDDLPKPTWGVENAPPVVGAVHKRPREPNESPPPEPTPSPPPQPPPSVAPLSQMRRVPSLTPQLSNGDRPSEYGMKRMPAHSPIPGANGQLQPLGYGQDVYQRGSPSPAMSSQQIQGATRQVSSPYIAQTGIPTRGSPLQVGGSTPTHHHLHHHPSPQHQAPYTTTTTVATPQTSYGYTPNPAHSARLSTGSFYQPPKPVEVYHLTDSLHAALPEDIRAQFHRDQHGRVLFFTAPPLHPLPPVKPGQAVRHSERYLAEKKKRRAAATDLTRKAEDDTSGGGNNHPGEKSEKRTKRDVDDNNVITVDLLDDLHALQNRALTLLSRQVEFGTRAR